ncbi:MAG: 23S rRNA (uracil(1939)-C(5))-methyltransferase RlmD [Candidatus Hydrogenedentes bacterium]|nr:23S rRNA (uracil(1939)-C(5))-methyltransferase RlmD [Candidatus Hydrogenedentota bacterium]
MSNPVNPAVLNVTASGLCRHFGECGGCATQDIPYPEQLAQKQAKLKELFAAYWDRDIPIVPSPQHWNYRNKVDFNFGLKHYDEPPPKDFERETVLGFTRKGKWYWPIQIDDCRIAPPCATQLLEAVRAWSASQGLRAYDSRTHEGLLHVLLLREGKRTGEKMVVLITAPGPFDADAFVQAVLGATDATSIYRGIYHGAARGAFADEVELLYGSETIEEELQIPIENGSRTLRFRISPFSFFQTNTLATELLYAEIRRWVQRVQPKILYDLYGGMGGIAFACADCVDLVRSVESEEVASRDGEHNAVLNGIDNVFFETQKMKNYLLNVLASGGMEPTSAVVLDPPRAGMTPKARKRLVEARPPDILYVSCKPAVFRDELEHLLDAYTLTDLRAHDLFPHTPHVELLASLKLR